MGKKIFGCSVGWLEKGEKIIGCGSKFVSFRKGKKMIRRGRLGEKKRMCVKVSKDWKNKILCGSKFWWTGKEKKMIGCGFKFVNFRKGEKMIGYGFKFWKIERKDWMWF